MRKSGRPLACINDVPIGIQFLPRNQEYWSIFPIPHSFMSRHRLLWNRRLFVFWLVSSHTFTTRKTQKPRHNSNENKVTTQEEESRNNQHASPFLLRSIVPHPQNVFAHFHLVVPRLILLPRGPSFEHLPTLSAPTSPEIFFRATRGGGGSAVRKISLCSGTRSCCYSNATLKVDIRIHSPSVIW